MDLPEYERMFEHESHHWWFVGTRRVILDVLRRRAPAGADGAPPRICDIGCGTGGTTARLSTLGAALGLDASAEALRLARRRPGGAFAQGDAARLPLATGAFDVATLLDIVEHTDDDAAVVAEAARVLRPGGLLLLTVPAFPFLWSQHDEALHHRRRYRSREIRKLLEDQGLQIDILTYYNSALFPAVAAIRLLSRLGRGGAGAPPKSDLSLPPAPLNGLLASLLGSERHLVGRIPLPAGVSLLATALKRG